MGLERRCTYVLRTYDAECCHSSFTTSSSSPQSRLLHACQVVTTQAHSNLLLEDEMLHNDISTSQHKDSTEQHDSSLFSPYWIALETKLLTDSTILLKTLGTEMKIVALMAAVSSLILAGFPHDTLNREIIWLLILVIVTSVQNRFCFFWKWTWISEIISYITSVVHKF